MRSAREFLGRRRLLATLIVLALMTAAIAWLLVYRDRIPPVAQRPLDVRKANEPRSFPAITGKAYRYFAGHCGLKFVVDFDVAYWDVDTSTLTEDENARFGINNDEGTITLVNEQTALYRSFKGGSATLQRRPGAAAPRFCG